MIRLDTRDRHPREGAAEPLASAAGPRARRILVVDDNQDAAELLVEFLRRSGHETCLAHDGPSAVSCAAEFAPDIVLLDLGLPVLDGYEVARRLRQQLGGERLGLIAITGPAPVMMVPPSRGRAVLGLLSPPEAVAARGHARASRNRQGVCVSPSATQRTSTTRIAERAPRSTASVCASVERCLKGP